MVRVISVSFRIELEIIHENAWLPFDYGTNQMVVDEGGGGCKDTVTNTEFYSKAFEDMFAREAFNFINTKQKEHKKTTNLHWIT